MTSRPKAVLATGNAGKLRELEALLGDYWNLLPQADLGIDEIAETGHSLLENALIKARHASASSGLPAIADDSGLEVEALGGEPGVQSSRYAGERADAAANNAKLLEALNKTPPDQRTARFRCVIVFVRRADDPDPVVAEGVWEGTISQVRSGEGGFGYDPVFVDAVSGRTAAELEPEEKRARSHRGQAVRCLLRQLEATGIPTQCGSGYAQPARFPGNS